MKRKPVAISGALSFGTFQQELELRRRLARISPARKNSLSVRLVGLGNFTV